MIYTAVNNAKIKNLSKLKNKKYRDETSTFLIEGEHLVVEAANAGFLKEVFLKEGTSYRSHVPVHEASVSVMKFLSHLETPPTMIGLCKKKDSEEIGDKILLLEDIQDPGNIGTIIRSAVAFQIDTILLTKGCADVYGPKVVRATQGMLFHTSIITGEIEELIHKIQEKEIPIFGTKVNGGKSLKTVEKISKFAIIMGNEGSGISEKALEACNSYIYIDMNEECESLNVGVAASIIMYELSKKV